MGFQSLMDSEAVRTAAISTVMATIGWASHTMLELGSQNTQLLDQKTQIQALFNGQRETHAALQDLNTTIVRVEGKLDVVNQKIDDDRATRHR